MSSAPRPPHSQLHYRSKSTIQSKAPWKSKLSPRNSRDPPRLDRIHPRQYHLPLPPPTATQAPRPSIPPYTKPSYDWLLSNLHNPYPSRDTRDAISRTSAAARKDVDSWFTDARRRIGWNDARRSYFSNKRAEMVRAASRFYDGGGGKVYLSQDAEYALVSIAKRAQGLYCDKFGET
ncbi:hypothetical protein C0992_007044, partial [Termitomyces sp. T32_za158]